jgi:hypothetical protein
MIERKAFDLTRYLHDGTFNQKGFANHLADLSIETADNLPVHERITPFTLEVLLGGRVVDRSLDDRDVSGHYDEETEFQKKEKVAALKIRESLLTEPEGTVSVWISPPEGELNYKEGRITVGVSKTKAGVKQLESYGIPTQLTAEQNLLIAWRLAEFSDKDYSHINHPEDLRSEVITFIPPDNSSPWELLRELIPMDEVWDAIETGGVKEVKEEAVSTALKVYEEVEYMIRAARTEQDYTDAGAYAERLMGERGRPIKSGPCGLTNSDLINQTTPFIHTHISIDIQGKPTTSISERGNFVKNCGKCGKSINRTISAGYQCACGGVYEGC